MHTTCTPASAMMRRILNISIGSGVVRRLGSLVLPAMQPVVPMMPQRMPAASKMLLSRKVVVVLPLVPVMPTSFMRCCGWPLKALAMRVMAARTSVTSTCGQSMSSSRSTTSATQPFSIACGAKSCASTLPPRMQKNRPFSHCSREFAVSDAISASPVSFTSSGISIVSCDSFMLIPPLLQRTWVTAPGIRP